jgi:hypothetical protein
MLRKTQRRGARCKLGIFDAKCRQRVRNTEKLMATWRDVRRIALKLPGASEEVRSSGTSAWIVNKKFFAWERPLRRSDIAALGDRAPMGPILGVRTSDLEMKDVFLANDPKVFFTTPHFDGYAAVLIQLDKISTSQLKDAIVEAWLASAGKRAVAAYMKASR